MNNILDLLQRNGELERDNNVKSDYMEQLTREHYAETKAMNEERHKSNERYNKLYDDYVELHREKSKLEYENKQLREALLHYSNASTYLDPIQIKQGEGTISVHPSHIAREVLGIKEEEVC